ncbi:MAG: glycosyltransferase family 4 protein [Acidobacteriia bacterium]|nr:glycosyltransferase family 4 protein [Terriglobia bacterium]
MRLAVVSPFLDRSHGTERCIVEQIERLARLPGWEIHVYSQRVEQVAGVSRDFSPGQIVWHKIPEFPGPHLLRYLWWFAANHIYRWRDRRTGRVRPDLVYSPGINCADADVIAVHIVFQAYYRQAGSRLRFRGSPLTSWPRRLHRRLYYRLIMFLESYVYTKPKTRLLAVSRLVASRLSTFFQRSDVLVVPNAVDIHRFTPEIRSQRRAASREKAGLAANDFVVLLVGNDWETKGLPALLRSLAECRDLPIHLLVVGADDQSVFLPVIEKLGLQGRVHFTGSSADVMQFYAAADVYSSPSLDDSFALPPLEAMACGLPVITSVNNGGSQTITEGVDGFVLQDPLDSAALARLLRCLYEQAPLRSRIGENAARTVQAYNWDRNARETGDALTAALERKRQHLSVEEEAAG